jgi:hypothetical protein
MRYAHTNTIARDRRRPVEFYEEVFECTLVPPERRRAGAWLERGTSRPAPRLRLLRSFLPQDDPGEKRIVAGSGRRLRQGRGKGSSKGAGIS